MCLGQSKQQTLASRKKERQARKKKKYKKGKKEKLSVEGMFLAYRWDWRDDPVLKAVASLPEVRVQFPILMAL